MNTNHIPGPRSANCNHPVFSGNADNFTRYEKVIDMNIFQGRGGNGFVNHAMGAIDKSTSDLHDLEDAGNMFAFHNNRPRTRDDVMKLLFKEGSQGMIAMQEKRYGEAVAQVLKYASTITRQGANPKRFVEGIHAWRDKNGFRFKLGDTTISKRRMELHGLVSIARRMSCNNYWTAVSAKMASKWKLKLVRDRKHNKMKEGEFLVDVGPYLPEQLKKVFREKQVVSFVTEEGETRNLEGEAELCLAGLASDMRRSGMKEEQLDEIYERVSRLAYSSEPENTENKTTTSTAQKRTEDKSTTRMTKEIEQTPKSPKKRKGEACRSSPRKTKGKTVTVTREMGGGKQVSGLLTQCKAVSDRVPPVRVLVMKS